MGSKPFAPQGEAWSFECLPEGGVPCVCVGVGYGKIVPQLLPTLMWVFSFALCIGNRQLWSTRDELLHVPICMTMSAAALLDHTPGSWGCLCIARLSPLPGPVCPGFLGCCPVCARTMVASSRPTKITPKTLGLCVQTKSFPRAQLAQISHQAVAWSVQGQGICPIQTGEWRGSLCPDC